MRGTIVRDIRHLFGDNLTIEWSETFGCALRALFIEESEDADMLL